MSHDDLGLMDSDGLVSEWARLEDEIVPLRERMLRVEHLLQRHMESDGATEFPSTDGTARLVPGRASFDNDKLDALYEHIPPLELQEAGAVVPSHEVRVHRKWNATKVKPFARRSADVRAIIEDARIEGAPKLRIARSQ